ncbi:hypothetical protein TNCV_694921 [Trichonephila clavipes]|nr:hypothetical protein TNCV_694921 [Trichonephila clavipes]
MCHKKRFSNHNQPNHPPSTPNKTMTTERKPTTPNTTGRAHPNVLPYPQKKREAITYRSGTGLKRMTRKPRSETLTTRLLQSPHNSEARSSDQDHTKPCPLPHLEVD